MGQHFGELAKVHGIVIHKISPFEQKAFAGVLSKGIPNTFRRFREKVFIVVPRECNELLQKNIQILMNFSIFSFPYRIRRLQLRRRLAHILLAQESKGLREWRLNKLKLIPKI